MRNLKLKYIKCHDKEVSELKAVIKSTKNVYMYKRYSVLLRHLEGLEMKHSPRAKRKLNTEQEEKIGL